MTVTIQNDALQHGVSRSGKLRLRNGIHVRRTTEPGTGVQRGLSCFQLGNGNGKTFRHLLVREACSDDLELLNLLVDLVAPVAHLYSPRCQRHHGRRTQVLLGEARTSHMQRG